MWGKWFQSDNMAKQRTCRGDEEGRARLALRQFFV
jgi:hypothetical protein